MKSSPQLFFNSNAAEAIDFYTKGFNASNHVLKFKDMPANPAFPIPEEMLDKVTHAEVRLDGVTLMISDAMPHMPVTFGTSCQIMIFFDQIDQLKSAFNALSVGGNVSFAPDKTFYAQCYADFTDKFGIVWKFIVQ